MNRSRLVRLALGALLAPMLMIGFAGAASAAEVTPIAEYVDQNVADTEAEIGAVVDDLGFEAE